MIPTAAHSERRLRRRFHRQAGVVGAQAADVGDPLGGTDLTVHESII